MIGLPEFDDPEPAPLLPAALALRAPSSSVAPAGAATAGELSDLPLAQPDCTFRVRIINCVQCGTHMQQLDDELHADEENPEHGLLCDRCIEWRQLMHRRDTYAHSVRNQSQHFIRRGAR